MFKNQGGTLLNAQKTKYISCIKLISKIREDIEGNKSANSLTDMIASLALDSK